MVHGKRKDSCFIRLEDGYLIVDQQKFAVDQQKFAVDQLREAKEFIQKFDEAILACEGEEELLQLEEFISEMAKLSPEADDSDVQSFYLN